MQRFAELLDRLAFEPQRNEKIRLVTDYFRSTSDPERGLALAVLSGTLDLPKARPALLRMLVEARVDPVLFAWSYDYVGDLAETVALIWPTPAAQQAPPGLAVIVDALRNAEPSTIADRIAGFLDGLDTQGRWALAKLVTGGLRVGLSARLAKSALAALGSRTLQEIDDVWSGLAPPYEALFAWAEGVGPAPARSSRAAFRPVMLAHALEDDTRAGLALADFQIEWKWDGIRVQASRFGAERRLYSRTGEDLAAAFPDVVDSLSFEGTIDGELLIVDGNGVRSFSELQQRLNRKQVSARHLARYPAGLMAYDLLFDGETDLRAQTLAHRRARLEALVARHGSARLTLSPLVEAADWPSLARLRANPPHPAIEGLMLKRKDSAYLAGRVTGPWWKWKREPYRIDAVLLYAQRGHGRRSSLYSDYTFGVWRASELVPVGKAYFGFTDAELIKIDRFVRENTVSRFGPVREVAHTAERGLVLEIAFDGLQRSTRHKSGLAMRFPRVHRLRWDKLPREADRIETLEALLNAGGDPPVPQIRVKA